MVKNWSNWHECHRGCQCQWHCHGDTMTPWHYDTVTLWPNNNLINCQTASNNLKYIIFTNYTINSAQTNYSDTTYFNFIIDRTMPLSTLYVTGFTRETRAKELGKVFGEWVSHYLGKKLSFYLRLVDSDLCKVLIFQHQKVIGNGTLLLNL